MWDPYGHFGVWKWRGSIKAPARVKVELSYLWEKKKKMCDGYEKCQIFCWKLEWQFHFCLFQGDMVWNSTKTYCKTILQKVIFLNVTEFSNHKGIWGQAEPSFGLCSSSAESYTSRKLEYVIFQTYCIASQGCNWNIFAIKSLI